MAEKIKNEAAVALAKLGAAKGGVARAKKLTPARRKEIASLAGRSQLKRRTPEERSETARRAANARWKKQK